MRHCHILSFWLSLSLMALSLYQGQPGDLDDEDELDAQLVNDFHFGGGFVKKAPAEGGQAGEEDRPRSKKEVGNLPVPIGYLAAPAAPMYNRLAKCAVWTCDIRHIEHAEQQAGTCGA